MLTHWRAAVCAKRRGTRKRKKSGTMDTETAKVQAAADAMFHKLFRLFGRRDRATASEIEEEALSALEIGEEEPVVDEFRGSNPFGPGFDCAEDVRFLP